MKLTDAYFPYSFPAELGKCVICPRECGADRLSGAVGQCGAGAFPGISSVCLHMGEEPVIGGESGVCNVFFTHCNLRCSYCQNCQISDKMAVPDPGFQSLPAVADAICSILDTGCSTLGFVSPSHMIPQMLLIIKAVHDRGKKPVIVYNTNAYDKVDILKSLEGVVDVYLPDLKYMDDSLGSLLSDVPDYASVATRALKEMYRQKGSALITSLDGKAESGMVVRHLVLPGFIKNSTDVLGFLAAELSTRIHLSLMAQYHPMPKVAFHPGLGRTISAWEYGEVVDAMERLGFCNGWIQELESSSHYLPDFNCDHPFADNLKIANNQ